MKKITMTIAILLATISLTSCREYSRNQDMLDKETEGKGDLLKAESTKKVKIEQSKADLESAKLDAQTKLTAAEANADAKLISAKANAEAKLISAKSEAAARIMNAESQAKANEMLNRSITATILEYNKINQWDGKLPTTTLGQGATPIINIK